MNTCPYCGKPMQSGCLYSPNYYAVYWLPEGQKLSKLVIRTKYIEEIGGVVLGNTTPFYFQAKDQPVTAYCSDCGCLITDLKSQK